MDPRNPIGAGGDAEDRNRQDPTRSPGPKCNWDQTAGQRRPAAWRCFKQGLGPQYGIFDLALELEHLADNYCVFYSPRQLLAVAMHHFVQLPWEEKLAAVGALRKWLETKGGLEWVEDGFRAAMRKLEDGGSRPPNEGRGDEA